MLKRLLGILMILVMAAQAGMALARDPADAAGSKDPPIFNRMPGFHIYRSEEIDFDKFEFKVDPDNTQIVEGRRYLVIYYANDGIKQPSGLQITRNYANAVGPLSPAASNLTDDGRAKNRRVELVVQ